MVVNTGGGHWITVFTTFFGANNGYGTDYNCPLVSAASASLAPPTATLAEPIAPEPPPPTLAPVSTALCPRHPYRRVPVPSMLSPWGFWYIQGILSTKSNPMPPRTTTNVRTGFLLRL
jgi:hypothetical protein